MTDITHCQMRQDQVAGHYATPMNLNVQITQQGMVLTWPGGHMRLADIHRVRI